MYHIDLKTIFLVIKTFIYFIYLSNNFIKMNELCKSLNINECYKIFLEIFVLNQYISLEVQSNDTNLL